MDRTGGYRNGGIRRGFGLPPTRPAGTLPPRQGDLRLGRSGEARCLATIRRRCRRLIRGGSAPAAHFTVTNCDDSGNRDAFASAVRSWGQTHVHTTIERELAGHL